MAGKKDIVEQALKLIAGSDPQKTAVGIIPGTFPGKKLPRVDALANNVDKFVYHSGVAEDIPSMKHGVDPQIGPWVTEVLEGSAEDDLVNEVMENAVPVSWWSKRPDWAVMKVARKLGKNPRDVTPEELAQHGHVALIPKKDPEAENMYWVGEQGLSSGPYSEVEDITGRKLKAYEADLYSGNYGPEGVERNEYITPRSVEPYLHLTGNELLDFLRKTGAYNKAHGGRIAKGPGGWLDDVVKMAGKVISGEGEDAAKAGIKAYHGTWNDNLTGFDNSLLGQNFNNRASKAGHWFSTNPDDAAFFGDNVYEVELSGNYKTLPSMEEMGKNVREKLNNIVYNSKVNDDTSSAAAKYVDYLDATHAPSHYTNVTAAELSKARQAGFDGAKLKGGETVQNVSETGDHYVVFNPELIRIIRKLGIAGASAMLGYNLMEQLDPKQALAASMADQDYQSSRPQRSMGGNNSISGALNVARGLNGGE